jgi:hypothetical protein
MVIINKDYKNVTKKSLYIDNQELYRDLKNAIEEIKDKNYKNNKIENELLLLKEELIKKDDIIIKLTYEYNKIKESQDYMELFLKDNNFNGFEDLINFFNKYINYNKNNKVIGNLNEVTYKDNSSILNKNIKQDTQDENIVDEVLETEIKIDNKSKENIDRETIIVDDIVDGAFETNINEDVIEDIKTEEISLKEDTTSEDKSSRLNKSNEDLPFKGCPVIIINNLDDFKIEWKEHVSGEIFRIIEDNKILKDKINKDETIDKETLNEVIEYIIIKKHYKNSRQNKSFIKKSILRSCELYKLYNNKLKYINFNFNNMVKISKDNWKLFLNYINIKIKDVVDSPSILISENNNKSEINKEDKTSEDISSIPIIDNTFNYNYILENKKGFLFEKNNKLYTYNLYEQKIIANKPQGLYCDYCSYTRYNTYPCIYRDCENRSFDNLEFKKYLKINKKEMDSKYNKNYNKI